MANKWVYMFDEGDMTMRNLLVVRGANLAEMTKIGLSCATGIYSNSQKLVHSTMKMVVRLTTRSWLRSWTALKRWKKSTERNSEILRTHY